MKKYLNGILVDMTSEEEKEIKAMHDAYDGDAVKLEVSELYLIMHKLTTRKTNGII